MLLIYGWLVWGKTNVSIGVQATPDKNTTGHNWRDAPNARVARARFKYQLFGKQSDCFIFSNHSYLTICAEDSVIPTLRYARQRLPVARDCVGAHAIVTL